MNGAVRAVFGLFDRKALQPKTLGEDRAARVVRIDEENARSRVHDLIKRPRALFDEGPEGLHLVAPAKSRSNALAMNSTIVEAGPGRPKVRGAVVSAAALALWFVSMVVLGAGLLARHVVALPTPAPSAMLGASLRVLRNAQNQDRWLAVHVLYAECRCSQRIVDHLLSSARPGDWSETVLWIGHPDPSPLLEERFDVRRIGPADLARYGVESAPMLIALDPSGRVRYAGGYTERKQGPVIDDLRILRAAQRPDVVASLPVFGCAVSRRLQRLFSALPSP